MKSIFQNSADIRKVIAESLELSTDDRDRFDYTYPIYHTAFFYLQKRFGISEFYDDDKEAGRWVLEFKGVYFMFRFHSDSLEIWVLSSDIDYLAYNTFPNQKGFCRFLRKRNDIKGLYWEEQLKIFKKHAKYTNEQYIEFEEKYGRCNSRHRYLLKILRKLLKAFMEEPIWVRDVPFNIKGRMNEKDIKHNYSEIKLVEK